MNKLNITRWRLLALVIFLFFSSTLYSQQLKLTDFVIFAGQNPPSLNNVTSPASPGFAVNIGSATTISGGHIGSYNLVNSTGNSALSCDINSGGIINLANGTTVKGNITAQNQNKLSGVVLSMGSNEYVQNNIAAAGNITIGGGTIAGSVTHPQGTTYTGPVPGGGEFIQTPSLPTLPNLPPVINFSATGSDITKGQTIAPGNYGNLKLNGNQTITFSGPGDYYFKSIHNKSSNYLVFDFKNTSAGNIRIFVAGDADLDKNTSSIINGGSASRILIEVLGNGTTTSINTFAFIISNGSSNSSSWMGTVWAPYAAISIGSGTGSSSITGSLWSTSQVNIQSGATINFSPFNGWTADTLIVPGYQPPVIGKSTDLIGPELAALCQTYSSGIIPNPSIYQITNGAVLVQVVCKSGFYSTVLSTLTTQYGMTGLIDNGPNTLIITGYIPITNLCTINSDANLANEVISFSPVYPPITSVGVATTEGDTAVRAYIARNAFHLTGAGIKVGVLSDGYNTIPGNPAATDVANGDLPGVGNPDNSTPVDVLLDYPYGRTTDEGRAMLQIIHDIAPKASLAFRTGFISEGDFAQGISALQQAGCNVIADDVTYITSPFFKDGLAAQAVNKVKALGVSYFSAAGNFGAKSYQAVFNPAPAPAGMVGQAHNFGGGDILQNDSLKAGVYTIVLQWEDSIYSLGQGGAKNDFDIYLADDNGNILFGMNRNNLGGDPIEVLSFLVKANTRANIMIVRAAGTTPNVRLKYIVYRGDLTFNEYATGTSTIVGQANASGAMAVAAARYTQTPAYGVNPAKVESFSSTGGTPVYGVVRNKPDFTAPDGVNTTVNFGSLDLEGDGIPNFFGTSAAAPHAAGVAALILQAKKLFYNKMLEPDSVRIVLSNTASDMSTPGFDNSTGSGLIQADAAIESFASPTPELDSLIIPANLDSSSIGKTTFNVTIKGKYLLPNTTVTVRGVPVTTQIVNSTQATAVITPFAGNPEIQLFTKPISPSGLDGNYSDTLYFFSLIKKKVVVIADNKSKKYGEQLPNFTAAITVNGVPLANTGISLADLNLDTIAYNTPATSMSNTGLYFIRPSFKHLTATDSLAFELYDFTFQDGVLFVKKMPLLITPKDTTVTYGDKIAGFQYNYTYGDSLIALSDRAAFLNTIIATHDSTINNNVVAFIDGKTIINGRTLTNADLFNMGVMASAKSIVNARTIVNARPIVNGALVTDTTKLIDLALQSIFNYQLDSSSSDLVNAKNIVNARTIVNAKSIINGIAEVNSKTIINGSTILNSNSVGDTSNQNVVVIIDQDDVPSQTNVLSNFTSVALITGITAGNFVIVPAAMISDNFEITYGLGKINILPTTLSVAAKDTFMYQGDSVPSFTSIINGLKNQDTLVSGPSYLLNPSYAGNAGTYSIIPSNVTLNCPECYITTYTSGTLYVDPKGKSAKNLKPQLLCVDTLVNDPSGLSYVANFNCNNPNTTVEYIPVGVNNFLSGDAAATAVGILPTIFQPGSNNNFQIKFNGSKLIWIVQTYNVYQKTAVAQDASSTSSRCKKATTSVALGMEQPVLYNNSIAGISPNPSQGSFLVTTDKGFISDRDVDVTDISGKKYSVTISRISARQLKIELPATAHNGIYIVKARVDNGYTIFKMVKL